MQYLNLMPHRLQKLSRLKLCLYAQNYQSLISSGVIVSADQSMFEAEPNNSFERHLCVPRAAFASGTNPDVEDDSLPWASISALLNPQNDYDYYEVELQAGETITADIDYGSNHGASVDTFIRGIYNSGYTLLTSNDDASISQGGSGSFHGYDSYASASVSDDGIYFIKVSAYNPASQTGDYVLNLGITPTDNSDGFGGGPSQSQIDSAFADLQFAEGEMDTAALELNAALQAESDASAHLDETLALYQQFDEVLIPDEIDLKTVTIDPSTGDLFISVQDSEGTFHTSTIFNQLFDPVDQVTVDIDADGISEIYQISTTFSKSDSSDTLVAGRIGTIGETLIGLGGSDLIFGGEGNDVILFGRRQ